MTNPSTPPLSPKRPRGGQIGNHNALTHGIFAAYARQRHACLLPSNDPIDFSAEIAALRHLIKTSMKRMDQPVALTLEETLSALRTIAFAAAVIHRLHRPIYPFNDPETPTEIPE